MKTVLTWDESRVLIDPPIICHASHKVGGEKAVKDSAN